MVLQELMDSTIGAALVLVGDRNHSLGDSNVLQASPSFTGSQVILPLAESVPGP
jgi:hypothetical protein